MLRDLDLHEMSAFVWCREAAKITWAYFHRSADALPFPPVLNFCSIYFGLSVGDGIVELDPVLLLLLIGNVSAAKAWI